MVAFGAWLPAIRIPERWWTARANAPAETLQGFVSPPAGHRARGRREIPRAATLRTEVNHDPRCSSRLRARHRRRHRRTDHHHHHRDHRPADPVAGSRRTIGRGLGDSAAALLGHDQLVDRGLVGTGRIAELEVEAALVAAADPGQDAELAPEPVL